MTSADRALAVSARDFDLSDVYKRQEYAYGVLLGRVAIYLITVILGIATGNWLEMLVFLLPFTVPVSYTHLDVSKRQIWYRLEKKQP